MLTVVRRPGSGRGHDLLRTVPLLCLVGCCLLLLRCEVARTKFSELPMCVQKGSYILMALCVWLYWLGH